MEQGGNDLQGSWDALHIDRACKDREISGSAIGYIRTCVANRIKVITSPASAKEIGSPMQHYAMSRRGSCNFDRSFRISLLTFGLEVCLKCNRTVAGGGKDQSRITILRAPRQPFFDVVVSLDSWHWWRVCSGIIIIREVLPVDEAKSCSSMMVGPNGGGSYVPLLLSMAAQHWIPISSSYISWDTRALVGSSTLHW